MSVNLQTRNEAGKAMHILSIGCFSFGVNDIVSLMLSCLRRMPDVVVHHCDSGKYSGLRRFYRKKFRRGVDEVCWLKSGWLRRIVGRTRPDVLMCVAGGYSPSGEDHQWLHERNVTTVCITLSDPDVMPVQTVHYGKYFDIFFTNAKESLADYRKIGIGAKLLPFAADTEYHRPLPGLDTEADVVIVGGARPERQRMVTKLREGGLSVLCFGNGWPAQVINGTTVPPRTVHGYEQVKAINRGRLYFSFALTMAGHVNVKVGLFEAAACGATILVDDFPELHDYFEVGREILGVRSENDALEKAKGLLKEPSSIRRIGKMARDRVLRDHKWEHRWDYVLKEIARYRD